MREERAALGRLQRSQRARVDQDVARQEEAIDRWSAQAETITASAPSPMPVAATADVVSGSFDLDEARIAVLAPDERTRRVIGARPASLHAREAWTRKAVALIGRDAPTLDSSPPPQSMDDVGIEL